MNSQHSLPEKTDRKRSKTVDDETKEPKVARKERRAPYKYHEVVTTKRPPLFFFLRSNYESFQASHPELTEGAAYKELYSQWGALSPEDRKPYEQMSLEEDAFIKAITTTEEPPVENPGTWFRISPTVAAVKIVNKRRPGVFYEQLNMKAAKKEHPGISFVLLRV